MSVTAPPRPPVSAPPPASAPRPDPEALIEEARRRARRRRALYGALALGVALAVGSFFGGGQGGLFSGHEGSASQPRGGSPGSRSGSSHHDRSVLLAGLKTRDSFLVVRPKLARMLAASSQEEWQSAELALARTSPRQVSPSTGRDVLLKRLQEEARKHHFEVVSLKFLPRRFAPMFVVRTTDYVSLAAAASSILASLGQDYEGAHLEAQDEFGVPFLAAYTLAAGSVRNPEDYPTWGLVFARSDPLKQALQRGFTSASAAPAATDVQPTPAATGASNAPPKSATDSGP